MYVTNYKEVDNYIWLFIALNRLEKLGLYKMYVNYKKHYLLNLIQKKHIIIAQINFDLSELENIESNIYRETIVNGKNINETIKKVSLICNCSELTIWKSCFLKVNLKIKDLINIIFNN